MSIEDEIDIVAETIRKRAAGWAEEDITLDQVTVIEGFLVGEVQALAQDLRLLLAAKGKPARRFSFDLVPAVPVVAPHVVSSSSPVAAQPRQKFQGRLVGTKEPVIADPETPVRKAEVLTEEQQKKLLETDVGFIGE